MQNPNVQYRVISSRLHTHGTDEERIQQMEDIANEMTLEDWRWIRTDGPLMIFERTVER